MPASNPVEPISAASQAASSRPTAGEGPPDYELSVFSYQHTILATAAAEANQKRPIPITLYRWCPPTINKTIGVVLAPSALFTIKGCTSLGTFFVPDDVDMSNALSKLLTAAPPPDRNIDSQFLAHLMAQLPIASSQGGTFQQFFSFPIFGNSPDLVFGDSLLPVWRWAKPDSHYRKNGFWEAELREVLQDGEWTGGKDLMVLMGEVSEQTLQTIASSGLGWKFSRLDQAELISSRGGFL